MTCKLLTCSIHWPAGQSAKATLPNVVSLNELNTVS